MFDRFQIRNNYSHQIPCKKCCSAELLQFDYKSDSVMPSNSYTIIAREGWLILFIVALTGLFLLYEFMPLYSIPVWLLLLVLVYLLRDPERTIPSSPLAVVSPVDGYVDNISSVQDKWIGRDALRIRLRMGYEDTYSIRSPIEGKIVKTWSSEPARLGTSEKIHRHAIWIQSDEGDDVLIVLYVGKIASRLKFYAHAGERVGQGQRCGYFFLGGIAEVYLPENSRVRVKQGNRVMSGTSILGQLVHQKTHPISAIPNPV